VVLLGLGFPFATNEIEVFAKISHVLFGDRIGSAVAALMGETRLIAGAIETDFQVCAALVTRLGAARQPWESVLPAATVAMTRQHGR
jgi:hypothetical protein